MVALVSVAALTAALVSAASAGPSASDQRGGTYRVGWESSFGWTNNFDPTGEYLANGFAIYSNLMLRTLVGFNHVAGPAEADQRRQEVHVQAEERDQMGSTREPRNHLA